MSVKKPKIFDEVKAGKIDTWDYQLDFANYFNNGLTIIPNENLISNIGFGAGATHTMDKTSIYANMPLGQMDEIIDPCALNYIFFHTSIGCLISLVHSNK